jgi:hypothetical protein
MEVLLLSKLLEGATYGPPPSSPARELAGVFCLALLFVAFGVPICLLIRGRKSKEDDQTCGNCGYDLQGLAHGPCPECGADIPGDQPSTNLDPDAHHHKRMDLGSQKKRFLLAFAAIPIVAALIVVAYALPRHPGNVIGTWAAGPSVSVTFDEQGRVSLNGTGFAPPFLADLHNLGRWDVAAGKLRLTTHDPGSPERTSKCRYSFKDGGNTLELTPSEGTTTWRFPREKR